MEDYKAAILSKTHYGLKIYGAVLQHYYPGETVLSFSGKDCKPAKNPYNQDKRTLQIQIVDTVAIHTDEEAAIPTGNAFDFAATHYQLSGEDLLQFLNKEMNLGIREKIPPIIAEHYIGELPASLPRPISCPSFSFFEPPIMNTVPSDTATLLEIYELLRGHYLMQKTHELRSIQGKQAARKFKASNFEYVTFSGTFSKRCDKALIRHSCLIVIDFDHIADILTLKSKLLSDPYFETELLFVSPSGDGLKWIIPIDVSMATHQDYFKAISNYIQQTYGLKVDQSGKDISRACFLAHDPGAFINPKYLS